MQRLGTPSWRLSVHADSSSVRFALYLRDRFDLPVPPSPDAPPRDERVSRDEAGLPDADRREAGPQWLAWWRRLVDAEFRVHAPIPPDVEPSTLARERIAERQSVYDPPSFEALRASPVLRAAALALFDAEHGPATSSAAVPRHRDGPEGFAWNLTRDVATALAAEHGVSPDRLDAAVLLIDVPGHWYHIPRPGTAVCTTGVATDPSAAESLLRAVFTSNLGA
ncbi:hypothetical protein [Actinospica robiniae]|uniref:hypothetical protein n=1 Tax=Actinospica robiniae TaxID=304901 RepID=UPI0004287929|nr:hypothetical protein [Actinospica robiniae]